MLYAGRYGHHTVTAKDLSELFFGVADIEEKQPRKKQNESPNVKLVDPTYWQSGEPLKAQRVMTRHPDHWIIQDLLTGEVKCIPKPKKQGGETTETQNEFQNDEKKDKTKCLFETSGRGLSSQLSRSSETDFYDPEKKK